MSTTKVLHVIARMNVGGTARYVGQLVEQIPNSALATGYVQGEELEDSIVEALQVFRIEHMGRKISPIGDFRSWLELRTLIRELHPDVVHTHTFKAGLIGRLISGNHKKVHTFHGHLFGDQSFSRFEMRVISFAEKYLARRSDLLISVGEKVGEELRSAGIGKNKRWISIPPGVTPLPTFAKAEARQRLALDPNQLLVGWMARMAPVKNPALLLSVARALPEVSFVMAGGGELLEEIKANAPSNVAVIGWSDAALFWSAVDCAISTSDNEGMPIALIEAQLAGIPVIATEVGSNSEVIDDGVTGIVTSSNPATISTALNSFLADPQKMRSMSIQAKIASREKFTVEGMCSAHLQSYRNL
jgi:glycosyltransferase involved in cell wall biosynthesis